jgi:hypothetical protein
VEKPLTHDQQAAIDFAASALHPADQSTFRRRVLEQLQALPELGDGIVHRVCATNQRSLFKPPAGDNLGPHEPRPLKRFG